MSGYDNKNKGVLFKNGNKETDRHPDYNGSINIDGTDYWLSAWLNTDKNGNKYMSLSRGERKDSPPESSSQSMQNEDSDIDLPF